MTGSRRGFLAIIMLAVLFGFSSGPLQAAEQTQPVFKIGVMPYLSTRSLLNTYQPIADAIEKRLQRPVQLLTAPDFDSFLERTLNGDYDLSVLAPHYARLAMVDRGFHALVRHVLPIRGLLVTARDRPLQKFSDLRGESIAIVDRSALLAIVGSVTLAEQGLIEGRDYQFSQSVSHSSALHNALTGNNRVALISHTTLVLAPPEVQARTIVWQELNKIPGLFYITPANTPDTLRRTLRDALLTFEKSANGQEFIEKTRHGGFMTPSTDDYRFLDRLLPETRQQLKNRPS
ncbi:MAG: phosphate/phosphite/phosphonate ABC transporter substrate-binding protein [Dechloromonas sp.]|nr:phosphate/phosphite/phosphonate ABC transporter substrate-binding protein [Dechloromonas sp.]